MVFVPNSPFPYPKGSFPQPVIAPDVEPDDPDTMGQFCFSQEWVPVMLGALDQLLLQATWQGDVDTVLLAQQRAGVLKDLIGNPQCSVETPYWDDSTDVGDNESFETQTWYGVVTDLLEPPSDLTFVENAAIWAFTGLLAIGVDVNLAIAFRTVAPSFYVAIRDGDFPEIINLYIDGGIAKSLTTPGTSSGIISVPVIGDPSLDSHMLYVVKAG